MGPGRGSSIGGRVRRRGRGRSLIVRPDRLHQGAPAPVPIYARGGRWASGSGTSRSTGSGNPSRSQAGLRGRNPNAETEIFDGETPLHYAARHGAPPFTIMMLLACGASVGSTHACGEPVHAAGEQGHTDIVRRRAAGASLPEIELLRLHCTTASRMAMHRSESPAAGLNNPYRKAAAPRKNNSKVTVRKSPEPRARRHAHTHIMHGSYRRHCWR
jgi:hypothetical protein